jgi:hypothetical protein
LRSGGEVAGIDLFLRAVRKAALRGRVTDGTTGVALETATIFLERIDAGNTGTLPLPVRAEFDKESNFTIKGVTPGSYQVWAMGPAKASRLIGRTFLTVAEQDIGEVNVLALPAREWKGEFRIEGAPDLRDARDSRSNAAPRVTLEPRSERGTIAEASPRFSSDPFSVTLMPDETYDVFCTQSSRQLLRFRGAGEWHRYACSGTVRLDGYRRSVRNRIRIRAADVWMAAVFGPAEMCGAERESR